MTNPKVLHVFALAAHGKGISGGDRIFIEITRRWSKLFPIKLHLWKEGVDMVKRQKLPIASIKDQVSSINDQGKSNNEKEITVNEINIPGWTKNIFILNYFFRIMEGISVGIQLKLENDPGTFIYNASEFWMDSLPCALLKLRYPKIKWVASWYQTAPNPLQGYSEKGKRDESYRLSAVLYWLSQLPIKPLINKFADKVIVNNESERDQFPAKDTIVLIGAVPLLEIKKYLTTHNQILKTKKYDAVFQGRFHPQKGVVELIDIWADVVKKIPTARLVMIGDGPLMNNVKLQITKYKLQKNIKLLGYVFDGEEKYKTFAQSKIVVHPAYYDSGGMASAEAMAFGLPCVGFDLEAYKSYYPKGMLKVKKGDKKVFSQEIVRLLKTKALYEKVALDAKDMIEKNWSWKIRADEVLRNITNEK